METFVRTLGSLLVTVIIFGMAYATLAAMYDNGAREGWMIATGGGFIALLLVAVALCWSD